MSDLDWRQRAACRGHDPDLWFPDKSETIKRDEAQRICATCPVVDACGEYAKRNGPFFGIWGGVQQNVALARAKYKSPLAWMTGLQPCGTLAAYRRHQRHGEKACGPCQAAASSYQRERERKAAK